MMMGWAMPSSSFCFESNSSVEAFSLDSTHLVVSLMAASMVDLSPALILSLASPDRVDFSP